MAEQVEYDCSPWAGETRRVLRSVLEDRAIPHAFQGTVLVVPAELEETVDEIVEDVASTARSAMGTEREQLAYDVSPWSTSSQNALVERLVEATIPHEWNAEGHLVVHEEDSEDFEALLGELGDPDGGDEMGGLELNEHLSSMFVLVDRLCNDPFDRKARKRFPKSAATIKRVATPFGVEPDEWRGLQRSVARLGELLADPAVAESAEESVGEAAGVVRDGLRRFV